MSRLLPCDVKVSLAISNQRNRALRLPCVSTFSGRERRNWLGVFEYIGLGIASKQGSATNEQIASGSYKSKLYVRFLIPADILTVARS